MNGNFSQKNEGDHSSVRGSNLIKAIGPIMAKRIVAQFGDDTLEILENEPERLTEVEGLRGASA